jgi:hypothetical protein
MKWFACSVAFVLFILGLGGCAPPGKGVIAEKPAAVGTRFSRTGTVTLHRGEPCSYQIMFDFHSPGTIGVVWLSAPMRETRMLTDAADCSCMVDVTGVWRNGATKHCRYVSVTSAEKHQW